jgi:hypothetical protein
VIVKSIERECFALMQMIAVARDILCRAPGCWQSATAGHHIFGRGAAVAFDPRYILGMCALCHVPWAHARPKEFDEWVQSWMDKHEYAEGVRLSQSIAKHLDYKKIKETLWAKLEDLRRV